MVDLFLTATDKKGSSILASVFLDAVGHSGGRDVLPLVVIFHFGWKNEGTQVQAGRGHVVEQPDQDRLSWCVQGCAIGLFTEPEFLSDECGPEFKAAQKVDGNQPRLEMACELAIDAAVTKHRNER